MLISNTLRNILFLKHQCKHFFEIHLRGTMLKDIACIQFDKGPNVTRFIYESRKAFTFVAPIRSSWSAKERENETCRQCARKLSDTCISQINAISRKNIVYRKRIILRTLAITRGRQPQGVSLSSFLKAELSRPAVVSPRVTITHLIIYCPYCLWHQLLSDFTQSGYER